MNSTPQPINVSSDAYRVWHEEYQLHHDVFKDVVVRMDATFFEKQLYGIISVWVINALFRVAPTMKRIALIAVPDTDYRETIKTAQRLWSSDRQLWITQAEDFLAEGEPDVD